MHLQGATPLVPGSVEDYLAKGGGASSPAAQLGQMPWVKVAPVRVARYASKRFQ
jgi:hypothetical protein